MAPKKTTPEPKPQTASRTPIRTLGAAIPLGIALLHGAIAGTGSTTANVPPQQGIVATSTVTGNSLAGLKCGGGTADSPPCVAPVPMLEKGHPVDWWFVFKFNAAKFPKCGGGVDGRTCPFGGTPGKYTSFGQQYVYASAESATLAQGSPECLGDGTSDPVGATFDEVYNGNYYFLIWNDQPYGAPEIDGCSGDGCGAPWGHSKGMLAWNDAGEGFVMQVSTPSWPLAGSAGHPRQGDGNTLGCVNDNDVEVSQHFFALRLTEPDLVTVLKGLQNASVVTDPTNAQVANNGGPSEVQALVKGLGPKSASVTPQNTVLSTGVRLISKPSDLNVPPWQMVSSLLGGVSLRAATWWTTPEIPATTASDPVPGCWSPALAAPGPVDIALSGQWANTTFSLKGGLGTNANHAKIGVSTSGSEHYAIFGDENQQGTLAGPNCASSQNGRGGMFFVMDNAEMSGSLGTLIGVSQTAQ
jgi:hypothetical protein